MQVGCSRSPLSASGAGVLSPVVWRAGTIIPSLKSVPGPETWWESWGREAGRVSASGEVTTSREDEAC